MVEHYDRLETQGQDERDARCSARLAKILVDTGLAERLGIDAARAGDRAVLTDLPVLRKSQLTQQQKVGNPLGGMTTRPIHEIGYLFQSPGPIYEPGGDTGDWWRFARAMHAAGLRRGDIVHNSFSYHLTPAGKMVESGARTIGAAVIPAGVGNTEAQIMAAAHYRANFYGGTPDFLKIMLDQAKELSVDLSAIDRALVGGGALFPSLREEYRDSGISCLQCYGTADLGLIAYESLALEGMILDEWVIVELLRPNETDPVDDGEVGEVVVTVLNPDYPLLRFATGDLSAFMPGQSSCGRTNRRIRGWLGRADQTTKVRGMFVWPGQVGQLTGRFDSVVRAQLVVSRQGERDHVVLRAECVDGGDAGLAESIAEAAQAIFKLRVELALLKPDTLVDASKLILDERKYS